MKRKQHSTSIGTRSSIPSRFPSIDLRSPKLANLPSISLRHSPDKLTYDSSMPTLTYFSSHRSSIAELSPKTLGPSSSSRLLETHSGRHLNKLGPGYYIIPESDRGPSFEFSLTNRFDLNYRDRIEHYLMQAAHVMSNKPKGIAILKNKDMTPFRPKTKLDVLEKKAIERDSKIKAIQHHKEEILQERKSKKLQLIEEKNRRVEVRKHRAAASQVVRSWSVLSSIITAAFAINVRFQHVTRRKLRAEYNLKVLMAGCHAAGKIVFKLRALRVQKALKVLAKLTPFIGKFLARRRRYYADCLAYVVERSLTQGMLMRMMLTWKQKLLLMQREWRSAMMYRVQMLETIKHNWNELEQELSKSKKVLTKSRSQARLNERIERMARIVTTMPDEEKERMIKEYIHKLTQDYYEAMRKYKLLESEMRKQMQSEGDHEGRHRNYRIRARLPPKPKLVISIAKDTLRELITSALEAKTAERPKLVHSQSLVVGKL
mmetsp:Transcript_9373/g.18015  ORF Transcript_9373/g.18015 Transcript_9373/m.18015 type:complete len:488 (+) Transcript_9373:3860-5323(+)